MDQVHLEESSSVSALSGKPEKLLESLDALLKQADDFNSFLVAKKRKHMREREPRQSSAKRKRPKHADDDEQDSSVAVGSYLTRQPSILKGGNLKDYQLEALNWMISLREANLNGILADDMGLGKTIQSIALLGYLSEFKKISGPTLIVAPLTTLRNWQRELATWMPSLKTVVLFATEKERNATYKQHIRYNNFDVIVTSYQGVLNCFNWLNKVRWQVLIVDEAHRIKNDETIISQYLRYYSAEFKLLMTGTPLSNDLHELWSLLNFILPEIFRDPKIFDNIYNSVESLKGQSKQKVQVEMAEKIHRVLGPFMKRRTKKEVESSLPPKTEMTLYISLTPLQVEMYRNYVRYLNPLGKNIWQKYANNQIQMRKICCHPYLFPGVEEDDLPDPGTKLIEVCGKMVVLDKLLHKLLREDHKILIFSQFTSMLDIIEDYCSFREYNICRIDGTMKLDEREKHIKRFRTEDDYRIFLLSTKAGGLGINLVEADVVVVYDMDWNPQNDLQAIDRAYRIGQKRPVTVYKFICEYSIEERMSEVQKIKLVWDDLVIQKGAIFMKNEASISNNDANRLAQLGIGDIFRIQGKVSDQDIDEIIRFGKEKDAKQLSEIRKNLEAKLIEQMGNRGNSSFNPFNIINERKHNNQVTTERDDNSDDEQGMKAYLRKRNEAKKQPALTGRSKDRYHSTSTYTVPYWQLFSRRIELEECYAKHENATQKYREEIQARIAELEVNGFPKWSQEEFGAFIEANLKYLKDEYEKIAAKVKTKTAKEVEEYSLAFYEKANSIHDLKKDLKKIVIAQERIAKERHQEKVVAWKREQYAPQLALLPHAAYTSRYVDHCIAKFVVENEDDWEDMELLEQFLKKDIALRVCIDSNLSDEKYLSKRLAKVVEWIGKEMDEDEFVKNFNANKEEKKGSKSSRAKQDNDQKYEKSHSKESKEESDNQEPKEEKVKQDSSDDERKQNEPTEVGSVANDDQKKEQKDQKKDKPIKPKPKKPRTKKDKASKNESPSKN